MLRPLALALAGAALISATPARAEDPPRAALADAPRGKVVEWQSQDGVAFRYLVPESYDPEKGVSLTIILHGSNLDRRWGFANHRAGTFRPDDIVVSPDGTTSNGRGGFNLLNTKQDLARVHALHDELRDAFSVRATYLYGHSQGSFFALLYAGEFPKDVQGVVAHASGRWSNTTLSKKGHDQAIVFLHGTADPVVPYIQSRGGYEAYASAGYPRLRLRSLEGWNHWPSEHNGSIGNVFVPHTSQQLAYVEGVTTDAPERLTWCFEFLAKAEAPEWHDYAGLRAVAARIEELPDLPKQLAARAKKARASVDALATEHVDLLRKPLTKWKNRSAPPEKDSEWVHLLTFLREFRGVPAADELRNEWAGLLGTHRKSAEKRLDDRWKAGRKEEAKDAFAHGVAAAEDAFLDVRVLNWNLLNALRDEFARADEIGLSKRVRARYEATVPRLREHLEKGVQSFMALNRKEAPR